MTSKTLFDALQAGDLSLSNRIAMAPLTRNRSPQGVPGDLTVSYYRQRASAGLIVSEGTAISQQGQGYSDVPGLYQPEQLAGWMQVTAAVHAEGGRIVAQLWHVGRISHTLLQAAGGSPVAPSALQAEARSYVIDPATGQGQFMPCSMPRALAADEMPALVQSYAQAASNALEAGFDGVELHAANGYLLEQFLKDGANQREDEWGGSIPNRCRLVLEVTRAVVQAIGGGRVGIRLSPISPANGIHESQPQPLYEHLVHELGPLNLAYLHLVEGATGGPRELPESPFDYPALKAAYRQAGGQGAWMVNNRYTRELAQAAVASGYADLVAFGKPFISNPDLVERLRHNHPLNKWHSESFYGGGAQGYTDYPSWNPDSAQ